MAADSEESPLKILTSIQKSFDLLNEKFLEALARLDEATTRISALGEIHLRLARTIMDVLGIPEDLGSASNFQGPMIAISSAQRIESITSGLLSPIIRNLGKPCRDISQAINVSKEEILKLTGSFDITEMDILAREFSKDPGRVLGSDEQEAFRNKIREWNHRLKDALS